MQTLVAFIITIGIVVLIHEFGHFIVAKWSGMRVEEFAVGFGPKLASRQVGETVYSIRAFPLGGFCRFSGENVYEEKRNKKTSEGDSVDVDGGKDRRTISESVDESRLFYAKPVWQRALVASAGPIMNFVLAAMLYTVVFAGAGVAVGVQSGTTIGEVVPGAPAADAGLRPGDQVLEVNGKAVRAWEDMAKEINANANVPISMKVKRGGELIELTVTPKSERKGGPGLIGIVASTQTERVGPLEAARLGLLQTWHATVATLQAVLQMITGQAAGQLAGPVQIAKISGQAASFGWVSFLSFMAILSINLGILNLLPLPALDGGRLLFLGVEAVRRRPINPEREGFVHFIGFAVLLFFLIVITFRDIAHLFGGM